MAASFPALNSPQRAGNVRNKVELKQGRSLMDWIKLGNSGKDIQGFGGKFQKVSSDELSKHNTVDDVWISIRGQVYNITQYLEYHPGGIPEIMRGAGTDATHLFNEVHQWVNAESMLQKCLIGPLIHSPREKKRATFLNSCNIPACLDQAIQTRKPLGGKAPASLSLLPPPSPAGSSNVEVKQEPLFWKCKVISLSDITHNVKLICFELPDDIKMEAPIGHHVYMKRTISGMEISRPYTVVVPSLISSEQEKENNNYLFLMIKIYPSGALTSSLLNLSCGDLCLLNGYSGNFEVSRLKEVKEIYMVAGGTGFTPMIRIINLFTEGKLPSLRIIKLLFANREEKDIIWKKELDEVMESNERFQVFYFLSNPPDPWSGYTGRITKSSLQALLPDCAPASSEKDQLVCVCGPDPFTLEHIKNLKNLGYQDKSIHAFLS